MLWGAEIQFGDLTVQAIVDAFVELLKKIFAFVGKEEGWTAAE